MQILFNHGLSTADLYVNVPKKVIDKNWYWFIRNCGANTSTYENALADPFKYSLVLIFNKIIKEKKRFKLPTKWEAFIDYEITTGDKFIEMRQYGLFQEVDFIESDFTGYSLKYYWKGKAYQKTMPVFIGGELKKLFIEKINKGEKFYTIEDFTLNDVLNDICLKFPNLTRKEIKDLVSLGYRRMHSAIINGCYMSFSTTKYSPIYVHIGEVTSDFHKQCNRYIFRLSKKYRILRRWKKENFDKKYYIGITQNNMDDFVLSNKVARTQLLIKRSMANYEMNVFSHFSRLTYIFEFPMNKWKGDCFWIQNKKIKNIKYMGMFKDFKFYPSDKSLKDLIKFYETRNS